MVANTRTTSIAKGEHETREANYSTECIRNRTESNQPKNNAHATQETTQPARSGEEDFKELFEQRKRFSFIKILGRGSYGVVCSAYDKVTDKNVAIKKISKLADPIVLKRTLREIKLLRYFRYVPNIVRLLEVLPVQSHDTNEIYLVEELMDADLHSIIRSKQTLTERHYQYFMFQMLLAVDEMHKLNVLHRDLKPGNILVNINCETKVCDFGLARGFPVTSAGIHLNSECMPDDLPMTEYVATRWYRAPEIMLFKKYDSSSDIWSLGCIFAELLNRKVMFPGKDYHDQLPKIVAKLGPIPASMLNRISNPKMRAYVDRLGSCLPNSHHHRGEHALDFEKGFPHASPQALDLLKRMLVYEPSKRITAREALRHPYLKIYADCIKVNKLGGAPHSTNQSGTMNASFVTSVLDINPQFRVLPDFSFEGTKSLPDIRQHLLQEISWCVSQYETEGNTNAGYRYFQI